MEALVKRLALRLKLRKISGGIIHHVAILQRVLERRNFKSKIVKGYCVIDETKEACQHYWVALESGEILDIGFEFAKLTSPGLQLLDPVRTESLAPDLIRSDQTETALLAENERLHELYLRDSKAFWRESPSDVRNFR